MRISAALVIATLLAGACSDSDTDATPTTSVSTDDAPSTTATPTETTDTATTTSIAAAPFVPERRERDCETPSLRGRAGADIMATSVECWWVTVPVHHDDPTGATYDLAVTRLVSPADEPGAPVIYLSGGPGWAGGTAEFWGRGPLVAERDVIVWDQRGTGESMPSTECPAMEANVIATFAQDLPHADEVAARAAAVATCHTQLTEQGIDLASFSTPASAGDLGLIREALDIDEWHLFGISYGTRLALETMRSHPEGIRSVILDSVYPTTVGAPDRLRRSANRVFDALLEACATTTCAETNPDLADNLDAALALYDDSPYAYTANVDDVPTDFVLTGPDLFAGLFNSMYDTGLVPVIPGVIERFADGDVSVVVAQTETGIDFLNLASEGMAIATECADNGNLGTADEWADVVDDIDRLRTLHLVVPGLACADFPVPPVDPAFNEPVRSDIPALVLAGGLDPITPPEDSLDAAENLPNATTVLFDFVAHGVVFASDCGTTLAVDFLRDPDASLDISCVADGPRPWLPVD